MKARAFLFRNGTAAFCDESGQQVPDMQVHGWRGLHLFAERFPDGIISIQACHALEPELWPNLLKNLAKPEAV
jgi:hypothetical protein